METIKKRRCSYVSLPSIKGNPILYWDRWYASNTSKYHRAKELLGSAIYTLCGKNFNTKALSRFSDDPPNYDTCFVCFQNTHKHRNKDLTQTPEIIYAAGINLAGLWGPFKMSYNEELKSYWDKSGNFNIKQLGETNHENRVITFASANMHDVEMWANGVKAAMTRLRDWCV